MGCKNHCRTLVQALLRSDLVLVSIALCLASVLWAVQLTVFHDVFDAGAFPYELMAYLAPSWVWAGVYALHALSVWSSLWRMEKLRHVRLITDGILGLVLWTFSTVALYVAYWLKGDTAALPVAIPSSTVMTMMAWWRMVRLWAACSKNGD